MCAKMPILIESVGDQGLRVEQGFEWPADSATDRLSRQTRGRRARVAKRPGHCPSITAEAFAAIEATLPEESHG